MNNRQGELGPLPFRTERIYYLERGWFFAVRDGDDQGPFSERQQAVAELKQFLGQFKH